ncbi:hypothetical protein GCM10010156_44490 [Planobispora rosea]|uniref:Superoxide dismutase [Cu-Zn] n=1 Tax=Planobispora rosea TaxID=35762 RepID=A0A8J3S4G9_PLARO|nr:superoxide dismutase family protein [Planobispora rosea]GGS80809.1 hypothetical protein GCM10010156_44490 [Planobispora rosea]GIH85960.1 hypothetical protein Pro02_43680 [Planobispora rosea]
MILRRTHLAITAALATGVAVVAVSAAAEAVPSGGERSAAATIRDAKGNVVGRLNVAREGYGKARVTVTVKGLTPGFHGFHIHATGKCDPEAVDPATGKVTPFFSAGGHFDLGKGSHGEHSGDLPPLLAGKDGTATASVVTDAFRVRQLSDKDGSAVIVHALPDNLAHIPERYSTEIDEVTLKTGDAGGRVACGVIK